MHPGGTFDWTDREAMLSFVGKQAFAHIFGASDAGLFVVHAPVLVTGDGKVRFHLGRRNRIVDHLDGRAALISVLGRDSYHSANWYVSPNQVPTWHYESVEVEGRVRRLSNEELVDQLDGLSAEMEGRFSPDKPWTRAKMDESAFSAMTKALAGFEIDPSDVRGTRKLNQHKKGADLTATIDGQREAGRRDIVEAIEEVLPSDK